MTTSESKGRFFTKRIDSNLFAWRIESNRFESRIGMLYYIAAVWRAGRIDLTQTFFVSDRDANSFVSCQVGSSRSSSSSRSHGYSCRQRLNSDASAAAVHHSRARFCFTRWADRQRLVNRTCWSSSSVRSSVCHTPVLCRSSWADRQSISAIVTSVGVLRSLLSLSQNAASRSAPSTPWVQKNKTPNSWP